MRIFHHVLIQRSWWSWRLARWLKTTRENATRMFHVISICSTSPHVFDLTPVSRNRICQVQALCLIALRRRSATSFQNFLILNPVRELCISLRKASHMNITLPNQFFNECSYEKYYRSDVQQNKIRLHVFKLAVLKRTLPEECEFLLVARRIAWITAAPGASRLAFRFYYVRILLLNLREVDLDLFWRFPWAVSYTHLTLPTKRIV